MTSINVDSLLTLNNPSIIDIRNTQSYNNNHIPGAMNIPFEKLLCNANIYLNKNETYYIYCQRGISTLKICQILNNLGYKTVSIDGGYEAWVLKK